MPNQLDLFIKLKYCIQDFLQGNGTDVDLANYCGMPMSRFREELIMWGVLDVTGHPREFVSEQDVFNAIFMLEIKRLSEMLRKRGK